MGHNGEEKKSKLKIPSGENITTSSFLCGFFSPSKKALYKPPIINPAQRKLRAYPVVRTQFGLTVDGKLWYKK